MGDAQTIIDLKHISEVLIRNRCIRYIAEGSKVCQAECPEPSKLPDFSGTYVIKKPF